MPSKKTKPTEVVTSYKGFNKDLKCRDFQYEIGKTYTNESGAKVCEYGFHACEHPLDVFGYYAPAVSRYAIVEQSGTLSRHDEDTKVASSTITVKAEIGIPGLVKAAIEYVTSRCHPIDPDSPASATGTRGAASATGTRGAASATGYQGRVMGVEGNALFLVRRNDDGDITHARAAIAGRDGIKPDVWYSLNKSGEFVEVPE